MPALMSLEGPHNLGCMGCTRPTSQNVPLAGPVITSPAPCVNCIPGVHGFGGASSSLGFLTSPLALALIGLAIGGFAAYRTMHRRRR